MRARNTERYESALTGLARHVEAQGFEVRGGFHAWNRLEVLVDDLTRAYDAYELEGDVAPARAAFEAYTEDLAHKGLRPDAWVAGQVGQLLADLEASSGWVELTVQAAPQPLLAVSPDALEALLRAARTH